MYLRKKSVGGDMPVFLPVKQMLHKRATVQEETVDTNKELSEVSLHGSKETAKFSVLLHYTVV